MDTTTKTRIVQNTVFVLIAQITNIFLQMVYLVIAARYLGNVQFGKLSFAMAFTQMFLAVTDLGLFNYAVREISRKKEEAHRYFINLFVLKLLLGICVLTIIAFIISILNYPPRYNNYYLSFKSWSLLVLFKYYISCRFPIL